MEKEIGAVRQGEVADGGVFSETETRAFYDAYGGREWERLSSPFGRLLYELHCDFLAPDVGEGRAVLDAGCGPGRFSIYAARRGSRVTLLDLSGVQLEAAREKLAEAGLAGMADRFVRASVTDMSAMENESFDTAICYGAPLNYTLDKTQGAIAEFYRVLKKGGSLLLSVNSKGGVFRMMTTQSREGAESFFGRAEEFGVFEVLETGLEPAQYPGKHHPRRRFFESADIKALLESAGFEDVRLASCPCFAPERGGAAGALEDERIYETVKAVELAFYKKETMADAGTFLLARAVKR